MAGVGGTNYGTLRQRQGSVASLASANPVLAYGEFTMTYDGSTPILKIGDGIRQWLDLPNLAGAGVDQFANLLDVDLTSLADGDIATYDSTLAKWVNTPAGGGGGGGPTEFAQAFPTAMTTGLVSGGGTAIPTSWSGGGSLIVPGAFGFGFSSAGWYQVSAMVWAGFTGTLPSVLRVSIQTYDVAEAFADYPILPVPAAGSGSLGTTTSRSQPGITATLTTPVFYSDGSGIEGDDAVRIEMGWDSDATLTGATGGVATNALRADITRIA